MKQGLRIVSILTVVMVLVPQASMAWSSRASRTYYHLKTLSAVIEGYRVDFGHLPTSQDCWKCLRAEGYLASVEETGPPLDDWNHSIVFRVPGLQGEYDLYSVGEDGIDDGGEKDDVSLWLGVRDGYYWKRQWPRGRFTVKASCALGLVTLLARFFLPWRFVIPLAGLCVSAGVSLGSYWLLHPGVAPAHNGPLAISIAVFGAATSAFLLILFLRILKWGKAQNHGYQPTNRS